MADRPTTRSRRLSTQTGKRYEYYTDWSLASGPLGTKVVLADDKGRGDGLWGTQVTTSEGHPWRKLSASGGDIGGDFSTKSCVYASNPHFEGTSWKYMGTPKQSSFYSYSGPIWPLSPLTIGFPTVVPSSNASLDAWGATAIARCEPTNSIADASTFLGELIKDGLPSLVGAQTWKARAGSAKSAGSEFLNVEFGWLPLVSDVRKFADAVQRAHVVMKQYERDAGRTVRRRYYFPSSKTTTKTRIRTGADPYGSAAGNVPVMCGTGGSVDLTVETVTKRWFSGAFTYHLPSGYDSRDGMARKALFAKQVLGVRLTPETLWNLAPWSWAVDWFTNAGDVLHNLSHWQSNGLVMRYGYIMETISVKHTYTYEPPAGYTGGKVVPPLVLVTTVKTRRKANPFGFGLTWDGLSPLQKAIAVAVGLSRGK